MKILITILLAIVAVGCVDDAPETSANGQASATSTAYTVVGQKLQPGDPFPETLLIDGVEVKRSPVPEGLLAVFAPDGKDTKDDGTQGMACLCYNAQLCCAMPYEPFWRCETMRGTCREGRNNPWPPTPDGDYDYPRAPRGPRAPYPDE